MVFVILDADFKLLTAPCPAETTEDPTYGKFTWLETQPGESQIIPCPYKLYNNRPAKTASRNW